FYGVNFDFVVVLLISLVARGKAPAQSDIYTLSLHDALPILRMSRTQDRSATCSSDSASRTSRTRGRHSSRAESASASPSRARSRDRKSTRLNSSHVSISYAVFCLKKKKATPARTATR